jgi:SRSO17 transposase
MDRAAAVAPSAGDVDPAGWLDRLDDLFGRVLAPAFVRREPRLRAWSYLLGLSSGLERKNGWTLAEFAGDATPDGMQRLLNAAVWDADDVRDRLVGYLAAELGDPGGVLIADERGFLKSGRHWAGVQRQYAGTAGKITNCEVGVFLAYAVPGAGTRVLVDRELYVPKSWAGDPGRCAQAGIGEDAQFATKPQLARKMIERAVRAGLPFSWFTADEAYGDDGKLRDWLQETSIAYVVAVARDTQVPAGAGRRIRADQLPAKVPARGWQRLSCGPGSKGERLYDWAVADAGDGRRLLIRRSLTSGELAYYLCWSPCTATLSELVRVAGARWAVEESFQAAKNEAALDHCQARELTAWYRHITLAMCAHAWLAACAAGSRPPPGIEPGVRPGEGDRATEGASRLRTTFCPAASRS